MYTPHTHTHTHVAGMEVLTNAHKFVVTKHDG